MYQYVLTDTNEGRAFAPDARALLTATADVGGQGVSEPHRGFAAGLERDRASGCGRVRPKVAHSAKATRRPAIKTLVCLLVILSCGLRLAGSATNDAYGTAGGTTIALSGYKSAFQSPPGGVTTTIPKSVLFQYDVKGVDTNSLNTSSNWKLWAPGQQPTPTNSVSPEERISIAPVDVAPVTEMNQRWEYFSKQDKYGGILYKAYRADNPLQLINPFAPRSYGQSVAAELPRDPITGVPSGLTIFSIRFK